VSAALHLAKAGRHARATAILLGAGLPEPAARGARLAAYHAARALLADDAAPQRLADDAPAGEIDLAAATDAARLASGLVRAILPVLLARDRATEATAEAVQRELDLLDSAAR
jgi:hypothetical protein